MFPGMILRNLLPIRKHAPLPLIHGMPHLGLLCGSVLWILIFAFMVWRPAVPRMGLWMTWETRKATAWQRSPWPDTLQVYVAETGDRPRFLINGHEVNRRMLRTRLLEQLSRRAEWSVYFEADLNTLYMDDIYAIDTIQGCGAKVIWITPNMREEWQAQAQREE
jgi:biopolymer transport protein ExbD